MTDATPPLLAAKTTGVVQELRRGRPTHLWTGSAAGPSPQARDRVWPVRGWASARSQPGSGHPVANAVRPDLDRTAAAVDAGILDAPGPAGTRLRAHLTAAAVRLDPSADGPVGTPWTPPTAWSTRPW